MWNSSSSEIPKTTYGMTSGLEQQRRDERLAAEAPPRERDRGEDAEHDGAEARQHRDQRARLAAPRADRAFVKNWWYQWSVKPLSGNVGTSELLNEKISSTAIGA